MPEAHYALNPSLLSIERPRCPSCQAHLMLAQIEHSPGDTDLRSFECLKCHQVQRVLVGDPLKSANTGWMAAGGLRPPI
jgi:transposase-like protein